MKYEYEVTKEDLEWWDKEAREFERRRETLRKGISKEAREIILDEMSWAIEDLRDKEVVFDRLYGLLQPWD